MKFVKMILNIRVAAWAFCLSTLLAFTGCLDESTPQNNTPIAWVALYHGSPDGPNLDIEVGGDQLNSAPFTYATYTGYGAYYVGDRTFGFGPYSSNSIDLEDTYTLEKDKLYSIFIAGEYEDAELIFLNDDTTVPPVGKTKIRVINLSPDAGDIDLKITDAASNLVSDLSFKENTEYIEIEDGVIDFEIRASDDDELIVSIPDADLREQLTYTIVLRGYITPPTGNTNTKAAQILRNY